VHLYAQYRWAESVRDTPVDLLPLHVATSGASNPGYLGVGASPSILERLYALGLVAGRTYSLFLGTGWLDRRGGGVNGSNVFGGYDRARFKAPVYSYDMTANSADYLRVRVADVIIDHRGDDRPAQRRLSVMGDEPPFEAVLTTDRYPMLLPARITRKLMGNLYASPAQNASADAPLQLHAPYNGTVTIVLADGFAVTLPPEVLSNARNVSCFALPPSSPSSSSLNTSSSSSSGAEYAGPYYLSSTWLSQAYLMLDFETQRFHLAAAVPAPSHVMSTTWCPGTVPDPGMRDMPSGFAVKGLVGAIQGGVFGLAAVASIAVFAVLHFRRKRIAAEREAEEALAFGVPALGAEKAARGSSSGGTTSGEVEMRKICPPAAAAVEPEPAMPDVGAVRSRQASLVNPEAREGLPERSVSPVSDIEVETVPPRSGSAAAAATAKLTPSR
jgi:hypothetical protein